MTIASSAANCVRCNNLRKTLVLKWREITVSVSKHELTPTCALACSGGGFLLHRKCISKFLLQVQNKSFATILQNRTFSENLSTFPLYNSSVSLLPFEFGTSQVSTNSVYFSCNLNRFAVFGLALKHQTKFGVVKAVSDVNSGKNGFLRFFWNQALGRLYLIDFPTCFWTQNCLFTKQLFWLGYLNFSSSFSKFLGFHDCQTVI